MGRAVTVIFAALLLAFPAVALGVLHGPSLSLTDSDVPAVRGTGFKPNEHVRLQIVAGSRRAARTTTASGAGRFTMSLGTMAPSDCTGFSVTAVGSAGSRATFKRAPGVCAALAN